MNYVSTLTKTGQITVPKNVRDFLMVKPGQRITFNLRKNSVTLEREKTLEEITAEIDELIPAETKKNAKKRGKKTAGEIREKWLKSDAAKKYFEEELEATL